MFAQVNLPEPNAPLTMQNDGFRQFLSDKPGGGGGADSAESAEARKQRAEEAQRKKERAKAKQERRNMILKKQEAQLAEQSKYKDRAGERRKELDRAIKAGDAAPEEVPEAGMGAEAYLVANEEADAAALPSGPTFAQVGGREDLEQQQHRVSIAQSKYLGGDIEHTHLVKGLDFALLQKMRSELSAAELEKQKAAQAAAEADVARQQAPFGAKKASSRALPGSAAAAEPDAKSRRLESELARGVQRAVFVSSSRPNRALLSGRLLLAFDVSPDGPDGPSSVVRSEEDLSVGATAAAAQQLKDAAMPAPLLARLTKVLAYTSAARGGGGGGERPKKPKKAKAWASGGGVLAMKPLVIRPEVHEMDVVAAAEASATAPVAASSSSSTGGGTGLPSAASAAAAAVAQLADAKAAKQPAAPPPPKPIASALPARLGGEDVDDIFGDGVGSDYVCQPNEAQAKRAKQEAADASAVRRLAADIEGSAAAAGTSGGGGGGDEEDEEEEEEEEELEEDGALRQQPSAEVDGLLARALSEGKRGKLGADSMEVAEEDDEAEAELLKRMAGKDDAKKKEKPKKKDVAMDQQAGDSYAECFPESFEGYNLELGPDSDDEANIVRSKKEEDDEPDADGDEGGKGGKGKKGVSREKAEELKREAKLSRELVEVEKLMEERARKRDRRDAGMDDGGGGRDADVVSQNEMF